MKPLAAIILPFILYSKGWSVHEGELPLVASYTDATVIVQVMALPLHSVIGKPVDTLLSTLQSLNLSQYAGKPADSILSHLPPGVIDMKITGWRSIRRAEILHVVYPNKVVVEIHVKQFQYMNPDWVNTSTPTENWSVSLFRKETVAHIVIFNASTCINGCENKYK